MSDVRASDLTVWLCQTVAVVLRRSTPVGPDNRLHDLGLSSLAAVMLQYRLQSERALTASLETLSQDRTVSELATLLAAEATRREPVR